VQTQESTLLGTPQYMAPEQATGQHSSVDERTDVFALGTIVYEMLTGKAAFSGANIPEVVFKVVYEEPSPLALAVPELPPGISEAVGRAMAKSADARFPTVSAFIEALTGQPLLQLRTSGIMPPEVGFATGSKHRNTGHDAFAQTMGSVDSGSVVPPLSAAATVSPQAATLPSSPGGPIGPAVPTVPAKPSTKQKQAATMRRSTVLIIGIALACAAGAAVAVYLVMRSPGQPAQPQQPVVTTGGDAAVAPATPDATVAAVAPATADAAVPAPADAGVATVPAPADAGTVAVASPPDAGTGKRPPLRTPDAGSAKDEPEDETVKKNIEEAEASLAGGQTDRAERLANMVINSADSKPRQRARAHLVQGIVKCTQQHDQEGGAIALRNLRGFGALQGKLIATCKRAGVELR
jgi:serine/threonine-protein kinase